MSNGGSDARFDIAKLDEWRELFEYMQAKGVVPYLVLEDDSAWKGYDHGRYYREIVARLGYLPALLFNGGEEHNEYVDATQVDLTSIQTGSPTIVRSRHGNRLGHNSAARDA